MHVLEISKERSIFPEALSIQLVNNILSFCHHIVF